MGMPTPYERLTEQVNRRRVELHRSWKQLAQDAGISEAGLRAIRSGRYRASDLAKRKLEDALGWAPGSFDGVLDGADPVPAAAGARAVTANPQELRRLLAEAQDELRWLQPKYESTRKVIADRLQREIEELQAQLDLLEDNHHDHA